MGQRHAFSNYTGLQLPPLFPSEVQGLRIISTGGSRDQPTYYDDEFKATAATADCPVLHTRITDGPVSTVLWQDATSRFLQVTESGRRLSAAAC